VFSRYVALGDSTTEGLEDPYPDGRGYRGWADRLAEHIAGVEPTLQYANLAVRGRKLGQIRSEQLEPALAFEPDLASILGGINDILRRHVDLDVLGGELATMVAALRSAGATVLLVTFPDPTRVIRVAGAPVRRRVAAFNEAIRAVAEEHGAVVADLERHGVSDPRLWCADRLHANSHGHERIAAAAIEALGLAEPTRWWAQPLPGELPRRRLPAAVAQEAVWAGRHLAPWVLRRLRGVSSGDGRVAKRPALEPVLRD